MFSQQSIDDLNIVPELDSAAKVLKDSYFNEEAHFTKMFGSLFTQISAPEDEVKVERLEFSDIATRSQPDGTILALTKEQLTKAIIPALTPIATTVTDFTENRKPDSIYASQLPQFKPKKLNPSNGKRTFCSLNPKMTNRNSCIIL